MVRPSFDSLISLDTTQLRGFLVAALAAQMDELKQVAEGAEAPNDKMYAGMLKQLQKEHNDIKKMTEQKLNHKRPTHVVLTAGEGSIS